MFGFMDTNRGNFTVLNTAGYWPSFVLPNKNDFIPNHIRATGGWEYNLIEGAQKYIKDGAFILDIGANIGVWSVYLARNKSYKIHCFEPYLPTYYNLCSNLLINDALNVTAHRCALSDQDDYGKELPMFVTPANVGATRLGCVNESFVESKFTASLDYLDRMFPTEIVSFIKIDVEGHEEKVLRGGEQLLLRSKPVIYFESWNSEQGIQKSLFAYLESLNYTIHHINSDDYKAIPKE